VTSLLLLGLVSGLLISWLTTHLIYYPILAAVETMQDIANDLGRLASDLQQVVQQFKFSNDIGFDFRSAHLEIKGALLPKWQTVPVECDHRAEPFL
jgi:hypothetical protein